MGHAPHYKTTPAGCGAALYNQPHYYFCHQTLKYAHKVDSPMTAAVILP